MTVLSEGACRPSILPSGPGPNASNRQDNKRPMRSRTRSSKSAGEREAELFVTISSETGLHSVELPQDGLAASIVYQARNHAIASLTD